MSTHVSQGTLAYDNETGLRTRAVLASESEVCHIFAAQSQSHGRFRAVYFNGRTLFSYGSHYIIARILDGGVVLLNADKSTVTTNGHRHAARQATSHLTRFAIPNLNQWDSLISQFERNRRDIAAAKARGQDSTDPDSELARLATWHDSLIASARRDLLAEARQDIEDESGAFLARFFGFGRAWPAIKREAAKLNAAAVKADERDAAARALRDAKRFADMSDSEFLRFCPQDSATPYDAPTGTPGDLARGYGQFAQESFKKELTAAHKAAKRAGYTRRTRVLWERLKAFRSFVSQRAEREAEAARDKLVKQFEAARDGGRLANLPLWQYNNLPAERAAIEEAQAAERAAKLAAEYDAWRADPTAAKRPDSSLFAADSIERGVLLGFERSDAEAWRVSFLAWRASRGATLPSAKPCHDIAHRLTERFPDIAAELGGDPWRELLHGWTKAEAERRIALDAEAARIKSLEDAEAAEAWKDGATGLDYRRLSDSDGGALLRIEGESLVTSHGARVPLAEAIQAFRFVKLVKARGATWQRNGKRVRVGAYQLDSINSDGGFVAGCHKINWPEIERVAILAGVFEDAPSDAAEIKPIHA